MRGETLTTTWITTRRTVVIVAKKRSLRGFDPAVKKDGVDSQAVFVEVERFLFLCCLNRAVKNSLLSFFPTLNSDHISTAPCYLCAR